MTDDATPRTDGETLTEDEQRVLDQIDARLRANPNAAHCTVRLGAGEWTTVRHFVEALLVDRAASTGCHCGHDDGDHSERGACRMCFGFCRAASPAPTDNRDDVIEHVVTLLERGERVPLWLIRDLRAVLAPTAPEGNHP